MENQGENLFNQIEPIKDILSAITDMMPDRHLIVNEEGAVLHSFGNVKLEQFYVSPNHRPRSIAELTTPNNTKQALAALNESLQTNELVTFEVSSELSEIQKIRPNSNGPNEKQWFEVKIMPLGFLIEKKKLFIISTRNITERKLNELLLQKLVVTDPLTEIFNRRYATDELTRCFERFLRYKIHTTVLILDIDYFKKINDLYGHDIGDLVLIGLSKLLQENVRSADTVARIGGEEFVVIIPDAQVHNVQPFCERLVNKIENVQIPIPEGILRITVSGGLSEFMETDTKIQEILKRSDNALYESKSAGKNRITIA